MNIQTITELETELRRHPNSYSFHINGKFTLIDLWELIKDNLKRKGTDINV